MLYTFFMMVRERLPDTNEWQNWWFRRELAICHPGGHSSLFYNEAGRIVSSSTHCGWPLPLPHTFSRYKAGGSFEPYTGEW